MNYQPIAEEQREAVAEALGDWNVDDDAIRNAVETHKDKSKAALSRELKQNVRQFKRAGGRGVELADEIDSLRIALAVRSLTE
jgi:hypothetical protein